MDPLTNRNNLTNDKAASALQSKLDEIRMLSAGRSIFIFSGKPGCGKSLLAKEACGTIYSSHVWYGVSKADMDPMFLCKGLYDKLRETYTKYKCAEFEEACNSILDPLLYERYIVSIIKSFKKISKNKTVIVIDGADILSSIGLSWKVIKTAFNQASDNLNFIVTSRHSFTDNSLPAKLISKIFQTGDDFFKLSKHDFQSLSVNMLEPISDFKGLSIVYEMCEGWLHGILTAFNLINKNQLIPDIKELVKELDHFFVSINKHETDSKTYTNFLLLSKLDNIKIDFAIKQNNNSKIINYLITLLDYNHFIRKSKSTEFKIHTVFAKWLNQECDKTVRKAEVELFLNNAAYHEVIAGNIDKAISYIAQAKTYTKLEQFIRENIDYFIDFKEDKAIYEILNRIPETVLENTLWIALGYCFSSRSISPVKSGGMFRKTLEKFEKQGDETGILLACAGHVYNCFFISGEIEEGREYLSILERLLIKNESELSDAKLLAAYTSLAGGMFITAPKSGVKKILDRALALAEKLNYESCKLKLYHIYAIFLEFSLESRLAEKYTNLLITHSAKHKSSITYSSFSYSALLIHIYFCSSDKALEHITNKLRQNRMIVENMSPLIKVYTDVTEADKCIYSGEMSRAMMVMATNSTYEINRLPLMLSALTAAYKSFIYSAELSEEAESFTAMTIRKIRLLELPGYYKCFFHYAVGASHTMQGSFKNAEKELFKALDISEGNDRIASGVHAYLSYLYTTVGNSEKSSEHAFKSMMLCRKRQTHKFPLATPEIMLNLLEKAYSVSQTAEYSVELGYRHMDVSFNSGRDMIPVMQVDAFGDMTITLGEEKLESELLSGNFKTLIAILLSGKDFSAHQEIIQAYIWPSSNNDKARKSFDNLMSRMRKLISDNFKGVNSKDYIRISNGVVKLTNTKCNADDFLNLCTEARGFYEKGEFTSCLINILTAKDMYQDKFFPFVTDIETVDAKRQYTEQAFIDLLIISIKINEFLPDFISLDVYFSKWLDIYIHNPEMIKAAYSYYNKKSNTLKCFTIIKKYTEFLTAEGFSDEEIKELVFEIKSST